MGRRIKGILGYKKPSAASATAAVLAMSAIAVCFLTDPVTAYDAGKADETPYAYGTVLNTNMYTSRFYTVNFETGEFTSICRRPGCTHNTTECPYYGANSLIYYKDLVYYRIPPENTKTEPGLYRFRLKDGTTDLVIPQTVFDTYGTGDCTPLDDCAFLFVTDEAEPSPTVYSIYRYDFASGEAVLLGKNSDLPGCAESKPYVYDDDGTAVTWRGPYGYVVTDRSLGVISVTEDDPDAPLILKYDKRTYELDVTDNSADIPVGAELPKDLYLVDQATGEKRLILENTAHFPLYIEEKDIFIFIAKSSKDHADPAKPDSITRSGTEVWTMNGDGTDLHRICTIEDPFYGSDIMCRFKHYAMSDLCINGKVLVHIYRYSPISAADDGSVIYEAEWMNGCAVIDVETGEYKVIYPDGVPVSAMEMPG